MSVLVTGVTGFVGREVALRLLADGHAVVALARPRRGEPASARVTSALGCLPDGRRLAVVAGDLEQAGGGVDAGDLERLRATVDTVVHCAGDTAFFPTDARRFRAGHVEGPLALLAALAGGRLRRWVQVSTAFVCGRRSGLIREDEDDVGQAFHNPYERVKLEAERALRATGAQRAVDVCVVRPSIVVGAAPATAGGAPANLFLGFVRLVAGLARLADGARSLRIAGCPRAGFNIVPVEYVVGGIVALAQLPAAGKGVFHLVAEVPSQNAMLAMITTRLGVRGLSLVEPGEHGIPDASPLEGRVARMLAPYREYLEQDVRFDDRRARALLDAGGGPARPALDGAAVDRLIALALGAARSDLDRTSALTGAHP